MDEKDRLRFDFGDAGSLGRLNRREFIKLFGGGIVVFYSVGDSLSGQEGRRGGPGRPQPPADFNAYLLIRADGRVTGLTGKIEMGQGPITSLAQELADELDVPFESVDMIMGDTDLCPWDMGTFGSMTTRFFGPELRAAAAEARAVLIELAAERLGLPSDRLNVKDGVVFDAKNKDKKVSYAELTRGQKIERHLEKKPPVKSPAALAIVGRPELRRDAVPKVTGQAKYAGDMLRPGLLHARILRPPAHDAKFVSADVSAAEKVPGVRIIREGEFIAALHESPEAAAAALAKIDARFDRPAAAAPVDDASIYDHLLRVAPAGEVAAHAGSLAEGEKSAKLIIEKTYLNAYVAHAPIEPHTATAEVEGDRITIWASTQAPFGLKDEVAQALALPPEKVRVITPFVGGGFGGKTSSRQGVEAARLAKLTGRPVQVAWTRAEEFYYDTFRPAAIVKIKSGVGDSGNIVFWDYGVYFAGERGAQQFYDIPHHRTTIFGSAWRGIPGAHPFDTGAWRAPGNNTNTFARESQIDAMASAAGIDPLEFRLANLKDPRMVRVLKAAAEKFGWQPAKSPSGRGWGIACGPDAGTYVAHIAEAIVDKTTGAGRVKRVVCAQDMGLSVNPEGAKIQIEGAVTMGLGYALTEKIRFRGGEILDNNFDTYEIPRFSWTPEIEAIVLENRESAPQGGGEPAIIGMGAVVANAVFDAVGARLLELPMTPEKVRAALSAKS